MIFKIGNFVIDEENVEGLDTIAIKKVLSPNYFGYWNEDGYGESIKVKILDIDACIFIKTTFKNQGFSANIPISIDGQEMIIDFTNYKEVDCCFVEINFAPKGNSGLLKFREKVEYSLALNDVIEVPIRKLPSTVSFNVAGSSKSGATPINHIVPLKIGKDGFSGGNSLDVGIDSNASFLTATANIPCVSFLGSIKHTVVSNNTGSYTISLLKNGVPLQIYTFPITNSPTEQTLSLSYQGAIATDDTFKLAVTSSLVSNYYEFSYADNSEGISVSVCSNEPIVWKNVRAISVREAFVQLINKSSNSTILLKKYIFDNFIFDGYLTNNEGLRDEAGTINVSIFKLFEELNNKYPSSMSVSGGYANIIARCDFLVCNKPYLLNPITIEREVNSDMVYSSIKVGYNNWKADAPFSSLEYNGSREFVSDNSVSNKSLSLLNDWSSSSSIISEQMLKKREKQEIHWIVANKTTKRAETNEFITANVYNNDRAINLRITPSRNLERWAKFLVQDVKFASGNGNYNYSSLDTYTCGCGEGTGNVVETDAVKSNSLMGVFVYNIELERCDVDLASLKGCVSFPYCNEVIKAFVSEVKYKTTGLVELKAIELK